MRPKVAIYPHLVILRAVQHCYAIAVDALLYQIGILAIIPWLLYYYRTCEYVLLSTYTTSTVD